MAIEASKLRSLNYKCPKFHIITKVVFAIAQGLKHSNAMEIKFADKYAGILQNFVDMVQMPLFYWMH